MASTEHAFVWFRGRPSSRTPWNSVTTFQPMNRSGATIDEYIGEP